MPTSGCSLTEPQTAALAKLGCGLESAAGLAVLCGPAGVGKSAVLHHLAADLGAIGRSAAVRDLAAWLDPAADLPDVVLADDAHLAAAADLAALMARCRSRRPAATLVLDGEGRLFTLVARDPRLAQAVRIRASLLPGGVADTAALVTRRAESVGGPRFDEPALVALHEITGGVPAEIVRLADLTEVIATARPDGPITVAEIEAIHRRLSPHAA
jgi:hypothetical protein